MNKLAKMDEEYLLQTYRRIPINISHGKGAYLYTEDGTKYLDFFSGLAVNALGYGNKEIIRAVKAQLNKYIHLSNYYVSTPQIELAKRLVEYSGLSKVFFTNSGTEAVEASLKLLRKKFGPEKKVISFSNSFHGRTYGSLTLSGREKYKKYFTPLLSNIYQIEFNNIEQLERNINEETAAVYLELIQGEGGINVTSDKFVKKIVELQKKYRFAIVIDEIQSGIGRTGKAFAYNHFELKPNLILVAKAIGGGFPLGALISDVDYSNIFETGDHGTTFGGNPVACAAGITVMDEIFTKNLIRKVENNGNYFKSNLTKLALKFPKQIVDVRGVGFMLGIELSSNCTDLVDEFRSKKILVNCTNNNVLRILPPLITSKKEIDYFIKVFKMILAKFKK